MVLVPVVPFSSRDFPSFPCVFPPVPLISLHFISFHFISFHFISFHFISFHFISFHFISFHFISFHFIFIFISFHFISFHFISFHFMAESPASRLMVGGSQRGLPKPCSYFPSESAMSICETCLATKVELDTPVSLEVAVWQWQSARKSGEHAASARPLSRGRVARGPFGVCHTVRPLASHLSG